MKTYLNLMQKLVDSGNDKADRTGTGTLSLFGAQMRFDLNQAFPIITTKKIHFKSVVAELLWFLHGKTNINWLHQHGCTIWDEWADENGELGPIYGKQWRAWQTPVGVVDQITDVVQKLQSRPTSRRLVVSAWNTADLPDEAKSPQDNVRLGKMALAPCHLMMQFYVANGKLSCLFYARSQDFFLGTPFNISSYALLTVMMASVTGWQPGELIWTAGDVHLYKNHLRQAKEQLTREPFPLPQLRIKTQRASIFDYEPGDFELIGYHCHSPIRAPIAV